MNYNESSSKDIHRIALKLREAFKGESEDDATVACIAYTITAYWPEITLDTLIEATQNASEWIATYVDSLKSPVTDPKKVNG